MPVKKHKMHMQAHSAHRDTHRHRHMPPIEAVAAKAMRDSMGRLMGILVLKKKKSSNEN